MRWPREGTRSHELIEMLKRGEEVTVAELPVNPHGWLERARRHGYDVRSHADKSLRKPGVEAGRPPVRYKIQGR